MAGCDVLAFLPLGTVSSSTRVVHATGAVAVFVVTLRITLIAAIIVATLLVGSLWSSCQASWRCWGRATRCCGWCCPRHGAR